MNSRKIEIANLSKTIIISPLNWGLGHATRCIPIINALLKQNHRVVIASDGAALELLALEFPQLQRESIPSYNITYPEKGSLLFHVLKMVPRILQTIFKEHQALKELVKKHKADVVISDNRYGMYHRKLKSIYITHQLMIPTPFGAGFIAGLQSLFLKNFNQIWIPDDPGERNLSGKLSHNRWVTQQTKYIGVLSRFDDSLEAVNPNGFSEQLPFYLAVISGPEPERTAFEKLILKRAQESKSRFVVVGGSPNFNQNKSKGKVTHFPFLKAIHLKWMLENAELIISRAGYSTIMDLVTLGKSAVLIPTPGQIEQEYLMDYLQNLAQFKFVKQDEFDLKKVPSWETHFNSVPCKDAGNLNAALNALISTI